jgi:hypothetical protein
MQRRTPAKIGCAKELNMLSATLRAADAYTRAAPPLPEPVMAGQRKHGVLGTIVGFAVMFLIVALVILTRIGTYTVTHGHQPLFAPILSLFG